MLSDWLIQQVRCSQVYKFPVTEVTELATPGEDVKDYLATALLLAQGNPQQIRDQYQLRLKDAEDNALNILKKFLEDRVFPSEDKVVVRVAHFGEVLASTLLIDFENFWFPIYKLRFREKKDWAMRLSDLCLIKRLDGAKPLVCYGEVKTVSGKRNNDIAIEGHDSLVRGGRPKDYLSDSEILKFVSTMLYEARRLEEARFISEILEDVIKYDKRHDLFIVHSSEKWADEILDRLERHPLDSRLVDFSVRIVLISQLRQLIDTSYDRSTVVASTLVKLMDKQAYLQDTYISLESLIRNRQFRNDLAQVQARSIQEELLSVQPSINYTFDSGEVWRRCDYIFSNGSLLLREEFIPPEDAEKRKTILESLKMAAQSFEFLSKFATDVDREILLINAAICYHIAGYHANAQCLTKSVEEIFLAGGNQEWNTNLDTQLVWYFRKSLVSFLRRDIVQLQKSTQQAISFILTQQEKVISDAEEEEVAINIDNLYGHLLFQKSLYSFTEYCIRGDLKYFRAAQRNTDKSYHFFQQIGDARLGVIASELRTLLKLFEDQSTWSNIGKHGGSLIQSPIWTTYLSNLARDKSIVEFWTSQLKALQSELLTSDDSFIIQMPTSAGKTFIAELAILATLTEPSQKHCLYIAPYRALVNEIEDRLADTLGALGYRVSNLAGGFEFDNFQNFLAVESHVLVTTPEKADLLFRTHPEYFENISTIVIDEGHMVDEGVPSKEELNKARKTLAEELAQRGTLGRGTLLEILISRLKQKLPQAHFLFLSAVMPDVNADDFVNWLSKNSQKPLKVEKAARPSRQTIVRFKWLNAPEEKGEYNGRLEYFNTEGVPTFVHYFLQRELYYSGEFMRNGGLKTIRWPDVTNKAQTTAMLVIKFASNGSVLVFCAMPSEVRNVVENIIKSLKYYETDDRSVCDGLKYIENPNLESFDLAKEWLGDEHPLTRGLHYGVGLHYGPLPDPVRQAVEDDFRAGKIAVLVSTTTLGQGVNLPVKTAVIYSLERKFPEEKRTNQKERMIVDPVKKRDFWNMCGRAGRAGVETEGQIVFVAPSSHDNSLFNTFRNEDRIEPVESPLFKLLKALVEKRISQDTLVNYLDTHVLTLLAEEVVDMEDEAAISNFLKTSLVGIQAIRNNIALTPLVSAIKRTAIRINQEVPDQALRTIFASTGLQVKSCKMLESAVELFLLLRAGDVSEEVEENLYLNEELLEFALEACQDLPEMRPSRGIKVPKPEDELKLVKDWVKGKPISEIRSLSWTSEQEDDFGDYIANRVIYKLPWGFNGFLRILAFKLQKKYDELPLSWQCLPSMMKFGVNSVFACWICSFGVSSRQLALEVARHYPTENGSSFISFVKWVVNLPTEFLFQELTVGSTAEKKRLMEKINRIVADDSQLQFILQKQTVFESSVQGIRYGNRIDAALNVRKGDQLILQVDQDNSYDPWAIRVLFNGQHIGYVQRDKAKIISREMRLGRDFQAHAKKITPPLLNYPYPNIVMTIIG